MKCLKAVMDALKIYQIQTSTKQERTDLTKIINDHRSRIKEIYWSRGPYANFVLDLDNFDL